MAAKSRIVFFMRRISPQTGGGVVGPGVAPFALVTAGELEELANTLRQDIIKMLVPLVPGNWSNHCNGTRRVQARRHDGDLTKLSYRSSIHCRRILESSRAPSSGRTWPSHSSWPS